MTALIVARSVSRKKFYMENFIGTDHIFALVESGRFRMQSEGKQYTVAAGEGALFRANVLYCRQVLEPVKMHLFRYRSEQTLFLCDHIIFKDQTRIATTLHLLNRLDHGVFQNDFEKRRHLFEDLILQYEMENGIEPCKDPLIETAVLRITQSFQHGIDLAGIGDQSGLSYVQFLRRFKAHVGVTPSEYVAALRLQKAKDLLCDSDLPIWQIANACGFENEYYFSNFFKKHTTLSPSAFRASLT